jgi:hypothetical protein
MKSTDPFDELTSNTYGQETFKTKLYDSLRQRNELFGYDAQSGQRLQKNYHDNYFQNNYSGQNALYSSRDISQAPLDYYFDLRTNGNQKAVIGFTSLAPNLYDDNVVPSVPTVTKPNLYKSWEPFSTSATPVMKGCYTRFIPHEQVEVAPRQDIRYWGADLNSRFYERQIISSAEEHPYSNWYRRQGLINLVAENMPSRSDPYLKKIESSADSFASRIHENGGKPPAVTNF